MNSSACINYSKEKWPETIPSTRSCMDSLRKEAIQLVEVLDIKEIKSGFILHVIGYEWISSEEMCNYQGFVKNSSIDQLYHYHAALEPTCHSKSGRKEEQERKKEEREREEGEMLIAKEWDHQWWLLGVCWIIDNVVTRRSRSNHCHPKLSPLSFTMKKAKKNKKWREKIVDGLSVKP